MSSPRKPSFLRDLFVFMLGILAGAWLTILQLQIISDGHARTVSPTVARDTNDN